MKDDLVSMGLPQLLQYCDVYEEAVKDQPEEPGRENGRRISPKRTVARGRNPDYSNQTARVLIRN